MKKYMLLLLFDPMSEAISTNCTCLASKTVCAVSDLEQFNADELMS